MSTPTNNRTVSTGNNTTSANNLTVNAVKNFADVTSAAQLLDKLKTYGIQAGSALKGLLKKGASSSKVWVIMSIILIVQGVFAFFSQAGADYIIQNGRIISLFVSAIGMTFVVLTAGNVIPAKLKWAVIVIELVLMSFNAYVMPGYFGASSIGTQAEKLVSDDGEDANKVIQDIGTFYSTVSRAKANAASIMKNELERDNKKGIIYETASSISDKCTLPNQTFSGTIVVPTISKEVLSLYDMNNQLLDAHKKIAAQVSKYEQEAEGIRSNIAGTKKQIDEIVAMQVPGQISQLQHNAAVALQGDIQTVSKFDFKYSSTAKTLSKSDLSIDGFLRILPIIFDVIVIVLMVWLVFSRYTSSGDDSELEVAILESQKKALEKLLTDLKIRFSMSDVDFDEDNIALIAFLETHPEFIKLISKESKTYADVKELWTNCGEEMLSTYTTDGAKNYSLKGFSSLNSRYDATTVTAIMKKITPAEWDLIQEYFEEAELIIQYDTHIIKEILKIIRTLKPKFSVLGSNGLNQMKAYLTKMMINLDMDTTGQTFETWRELLTHFDQPELIQGINHKLLYALNTDDSEKNIIEQFVDIVKASNLNIKDLSSALEIMRSWSKDDTNLIVEWQEGKIYQSIRTVIIFAARGGFTCVGKIFEVYIHKSSNMGDATSLQKVELVVNTDSTYIADLLNTVKTPDLLPKLENLFTVKTGK